ncbi:pantoate--beta-alanine ligase [Neobacillus notoginsengisoli]|uniref:Pantothenate synthetase n=1 Tax=Neobacillus notoginsengisoli TaxID=1578198 RepID=A0A417YVD9_9BACI|nr:pantoate--beta-alanine ligase [Neobacillus notoginsengisoli]RHW41273.1 pantoate--beta-alanine ligase [Neobacillus notoginsengisoli]
MKTIENIKEMQNEILARKREGMSIGFVPTMGFLHEGHMSLIRKARAENDIVVVSIFVNPLQFGPNEDYEAYPRDMAQDSKLAEAEGVDYLFSPSVAEMYPNEPSVGVVVQKRTSVLCGKSRPGHFDGVATVLTKLFHIVLPDRAYFGQKDAQQVAVVEGLISDFNFPVELVPGETVREEDGLAKSSRNVFLTPDERKEAACLHLSLEAARAAIESGKKNPETIRELITTMIENQTSGIIDYIEIYSYPELEPIEELKGRFIIALAVRFSKARLIDNMIFNL